LIARDHRCVYVANSPGEAGVVVAWLAEQGIAAKEMNQATLGGLLGLTPFSTTGVCSTGIEVWVMQVDDVDRALRLLAQRADALNWAAAARREATGTIDAVCEDCGRTAAYPARQAGMVQDCPHCGAYVDVPSLDDRENWFDAAEGDDAATA